MKPILTLGVTHQDTRHSLLIVDSNDSTRNDLTKNLEKHYSICEASNGEQAIVLALQILPDLVISDLTIPGMTGSQLCYQLKQHENTNHIPVIILTSQDDVASRVEGFQLGADDYIMKPFLWDLLQHRIQNLIGNRKLLKEKYSKQVMFCFNEDNIESEQEAFMKRVKQVVACYLDNPAFNVEQFAREVGVSQIQLYRKLTIYTGKTPNDFIRQVRLKRAAELLTKKVGNVSEVAWRVGFNSLSYFAKCFKELHHCSPREYLHRMSD